MTFVVFNQYMPLEYYVSGNILAKYILNRCDEQESAEVERWLTQNPSNHNTLLFIAQSLNCA